MDQINLQRRKFLQVSTAAGGGILFSLSLPIASIVSASKTVDENKVPVFTPNAWIRIDRDNAITFIIDKSEMGQGVVTSLSMLLAEELDVDLTKVQTQFAPVNKVYNNPEMHSQGTGGSTSIKTSWEPLRKAGAMARAMLVEAAAQTWKVDGSACTTHMGHVIHKDNRLSYGELAVKATEIAVPDADDVKLKSKQQYHTIGKPAARLDNAIKTNGTAVFGIDVVVPGMLIATIKHCPVFNGTLKSVDDSKSKAINGVKHVIKLDNAIAVVAENYWQAKLGIDALDVTWDEGELSNLSSESLREQYKILVKEDGDEVRSEGNIDKAFAQADTIIEADYEAPYLAHATMEPMSCTADVQKDRCEMWVPTQMQTGTRNIAAQITGLSHEKIIINTTYLGGGFGRRGETDFVSQTVLISMAIQAPVKLIWSREEDLQHDYYRPATYNHFMAALDQDGNISAWLHKMVGPSILSRVIPNFVPNAMPGFLPDFLKDAAGGVAGFFFNMMTDPTSIEGASTIPYKIDNISVSFNKYESGVPVGFWRSVGSSQNAYVVECFFDELAAAAKKDPYTLRRDLLKNAPRHKAVLELAAEKAGWGKSLPEGHHQGIAVHESFGSFAAQVAEVSISAANEITVHKVVCAIDCGIVVNPDTVKAQMEGGIVYGLTAALYGEITLDKGRVQQSNFHDYAMLRMKQCPIIDVHLIDSDEPPSGVGEPGTPPIAPAVVNAIFAATGKPIRRLPIRLA